METLDRYSMSARRRHIALNATRYKIGLKQQWSLREIAHDVKVVFGLDKPPSATTITNDLVKLEEDGAKRDGYSDEANRLLLPENFAEWREMSFIAPKGKRYLTPKHQMAWFLLIATLALKIELPAWVIEYLEIEDLDVNDWAETQERLISIFLLAPPRHGKSDLLMHVMVWLILRDPNIRIIWCGGKLDISKLVTSWVKSELESNEFLIANYGPFETENDWSVGAFKVATRTIRLRMPTMTAVGKNSTILSLDADFIVVDDMFDIKSSESAAQIGKDVRWLYSQLYSRREPWTPLFGIGSHQPSPLGDGYSVMEANEDNEIVIVKQPAHDYVKCLPFEDDMVEEERHGDWCLLWSEIRPWWFLEAQRKTLGDVLFEVCYNQDISKSKLEFFAESILRADYQETEHDDKGRCIPPDLSPDATIGVLDRQRTIGLTPNCCVKKSFATVMGFDPASGEKKGTSESALIVYAACLVCHRRFVLDYWHKRQSPEKHPDTILEYALRYNVRRVRIEINAYQKALARDRKLTEAQQKGNFIIDEWFTGATKHDPAMGIPVLSRMMSTGVWSIPYMLPQDKEHMETMLTQLIRWPAEPNDVVMALWLAELSMQVYLDDLVTHVPLMYGNEDDIPAYLLDQVVEIDLAELDDDDEEQWVG